MKEKKSVLDLEALYKKICELGDTTSSFLAGIFGFSSTCILGAVHDLEQMHPGTIMIHSGGISSCLGKSKDDIDRFLRTSGRYQSLLRREKHIAAYSLEPAKQRIGRALLLRAIPEQRLLALESSIDFLAERQRREDENVVAQFTVNEDGKTMRGFSAGRE